MGELTECNYCTLIWYRGKYGKKNVRTRPSKKEGMEAWTAVVLRDEGEVAWFMQLTDHCVC